MENKRVLPPTYLFGSIVAMVILHWFTPLLKIMWYPWNLVGLIPLAAGVALNLLADAAFKKAHTTVKPFQKSSALITKGVFSISRHPMYLGLVLILLGLAVLMGSLSPLIVIIVFAVLMEQVFIRTEEKMLDNQFGPTWNAYKNKVRKWI